MKSPLALLLAGLVAPVFLRQEESDQKGGSAMTRFFAGESERLAQELEGSWVLLDYTDPTVPIGAGSATGFVTFHAGFMSWLLAIDSANDSFFGLRSFLILESGAFRYRVDEQANLQLASVMSFTNNTSSGDVTRDRTGNAFEYFTRLDEGVLELRDTDGIVLTFRKVEAGEFPDVAERTIEKHRSGTPSWEKTEDR